MLDEVPPGSPEWWVRRLYADIVARRPMVERTTEYYDGAHNLAFASKKFLDAFGGLFGAFADNWCEVVVEAVEERLNVNGFRIDQEAEADEDAWDIWQRNEMDAQSQLAHIESLVTGCAYATAWYDDHGGVELTVEPAVTAIVACHPKHQRRREAGLRLWRDDDGYEHAELFLPDDVYLLRSQNKISDGAGFVPQMRWQVDTATDADTDGNGRMANPLGVVPMVELRNRPRLHTSRRARNGAHSEIRSIIPLQDGINKLVADMLVTSEFAAFPQRWATGWEPQEDPETGEEKPPKLEPGAGNLWWTESAAKTGQFDAADLRNFTIAIDMMIQHVASISRTPPHYLSASADRLSGESIKAAETGLVSKTRRKMRHYGEAWEQLMRIAGQIADVPTLANAERAETVWGDPETRTEAQHVDAVLKKKDVEVPVQQLWEDLGYSPEQIRRFEAMRAEMDLFTEAARTEVPEVVGFDEVPDEAPDIEEV